MNLPDLVRRKDRAADIRGEIAPVEPKTSAGRQRAISFAKRARLRLVRADEYSAFRDFPRNPGWSVSQGAVRVSLAVAGGEPTYILGEAAAGAELTPIAFDWPLTGADAPFDLWIEPLSAKPAVLCVGPLMDPRAKLRALFRGEGVEVGPGLNPHVRPGPDVRVEYIEEKSPEEWRATYAKNKTPHDTLSPDILAHYRQGAAVALDHAPAESLDFVFSNHVFEHLMNPLQVLRNWLSRLKPRGVILGVIPDARYTFDLRQPFSTLEEFRAEDARGEFALPDEKYDRWRRHTFPRHNIEDLKRRNYSIHVHYYTPLVFRILFEELRTEGRVDSLFLDTAPNNKDFGFVMRKA